MNDQGGHPDCGLFNSSSGVGWDVGEFRPREGAEISYYTRDNQFLVFLSWYSSRRVAEDCSGFKVLIEEGSDRILGAHLLGPHAEEVINLFALAMASDVRAADLRGAVFAYPTVASDLGYML